MLINYEYLFTLKYFPLRKGKINGSVPLTTDVQLSWYLVTTDGEHCLSAELIYLFFYWVSF